jgi:hypothetical protein
VPSPMVRPSSYLPTRLFTLVALIPCLTAFLKSISGGFYTQLAQWFQCPVGKIVQRLLSGGFYTEPSGFTVLRGEFYRDCYTYTTAADENDKLIPTFFLEDKHDEKKLGSSRCTSSIRICGAFACSILVSYYLRWWMNIIDDGPATNWIE